jgi:hypothetical protein
MSDVNKIVAAILTNGRMPTISGEGAKTMDDWLAEYNAWVEALGKQDADTDRRNAEGMAEAMKTWNRS